MTVINEDAPTPSRAQNRLLRGIYNGRTIPIFADGKPSWATGMPTVTYGRWHPMTATGSTPKRRRRRSRLAARPH